MYLVPLGGLVTEDWALQQLKVFILAQQVLKSWLPGAISTLHWQVVLGPTFLLQQDSPKGPNTPAFGVLGTLKPHDLGA